MGTTADVLEDVLRKIAPSEETLEAAWSRRDEVRAIAGRYSGSLRTYASGSIAHQTANDDTDADLGVVLDRRSYPQLGPDGDGKGPSAIVESVRTFLREELIPAWTSL